MAFFDFGEDRSDVFDSSVGDAVAELELRGKTGEGAG